MWSVGCIFAELLLKEALFQGKGELELRVSTIFRLLGPPTKNSWPEYSSLPLAKTIALPSPQPHQFRTKFPYLTAAGLDLLTHLSYHLLFNSLPDVQAESDAWKCRRLTFAGDNLRWNPLTSPASGQAYLRRLTHLTIWLPADDAIAASQDVGSRVPNWIRRVPFE
jgi:serine/threonine protein kinase